MSTSEASRLSVGVIGAGPVGIALAKALAGAGHFLTGISTTDSKRAETLADQLPGLDVKDIETIIRESELVVLAIPAVQIEPLVLGLAKLSAFKPGQIVLHTAAAHGIDVLAPAAAAGAITMALHPALKFSGLSAIDGARLRDCFFAVDASPAVMPIAQALVIEMGGEPVVVPGPKRAAYAEAVELAGSFSALIVRQVLAILSAAEIEHPLDLIAPIMRSSLETSLRKPGNPFDPDDYADEFREFGF